MWIRLRIGKLAHYYCKVFTAPGKMVHKKRIYLLLILGARVLTLSPAFSPKLAYTLDSASYNFQLWVMNLSYFKLLDSEQFFSGHFNCFAVHMLVQIAFTNKLIV